MSTVPLRGIRVLRDPAGLCESACPRGSLFLVVETVISALDPALADVRRRDLGVSLSPDEPILEPESVSRTMLWAHQGPGSTLSLSGVAQRVGEFGYLLGWGTLQWTFGFAPT